MLAINNIVETIKENFPQVPTGLIIRDLNTIHKNFATITDICRETKTDLLDDLQNKVTWNLESLYGKKINTVFPLEFLDKNNKILETFYNFRFDKRTQILEIYHELDNNIQGLDAEINKVRITFSYIPADLITTNSITFNWEKANEVWDNELGNWNLSIPDEFSEAIEAKLMEKYIAKYNGNVALLSYYHNLYNENVINAKKYYNSGTIGYNVTLNKVLNMEDK